MKKRIIPALAVLMCLNSVAFASSTSEYSGSGDNQAHVTDAGQYKTVVISKLPDDGSTPANTADSSIVYINQTTSSAFTSTIDFAIKENPSYGKYKVRLGSPSGAIETSYFYIGVDTPNSETDVAMTRVGEENIKEGYWNVGYVLETDFTTYNNANAVKVAYDEAENTTYANDSVNKVIIIGGYNKEAEKPNSYLGDWPQTILSGSGEVKLAFQINYVPTEYKDSITAYLSQNTVSDRKLVAE